MDMLDNSSLANTSLSEKKIKKKSHKRKFIIEDVILKDVEKAEPCIVQFSNGVLKNSENVEGSLYRNASEKYLRRTKERILKVSSPNMTYSGKNFGEEVVNKYKERIFLGVLDKATNKMKLIETSSFLLHPQLQSASAPVADNYAGLSAVEKKMKLNESFGARKGRTRMKNFQESQLTFNDSMANVLKSALSGVTVDGDSEDWVNENTYETILPPCDKKCENVNDVYKLEEIVSDEELVTFNPAAMAWLAGENDEKIEKMSALFRQTLANLKMISNAVIKTDPELCEWQAKMMCVALFTEKLIETINNRQKENTLKDCPKFIQDKIRNLFTDGKSRMLTTQQRDKLIIYIIILALLSNKLEVQWTALCTVGTVKKDRLETLLKVIGATLSKDKGCVVLKFPLTKVPPKMPRDRKKKK